MHAVLGIDAAWTAAQPSGVALAVERGNGWRMIGAVASYQRFHALADERQPAEPRPMGSSPDALALLLSASFLCGCSVDLVAIDMPLALSPIIGRRPADDAVSRAYGARKCGTHTPSAIPPGRISDALREGCERAGFPLQTDRLAPPGVIEVYPHPALVELAGALERLPYKTSKVGSYWPLASPPERRTLLYRQWSEIVALLEGEIADAAATLPRLELNASSWKVKAFEDTLDAIVCAWVAICALETGQAIRRPGFGDMDSERYFGDQGMTADVCERGREKPPPQQLTECDWRFFTRASRSPLTRHVLRHALQRHLHFLIGVGSHLDCRAAITRGGTRTLARHQKTGEAD